ncbi:MAG: MerC family mercury resistance protein [Betaproteobacteria bacterium]
MALKPNQLEKLGSGAAVIAAAACPICFPKLALIGAFFGLGGLAAYESQLFVAAQALVLLAAGGHAFGWWRTRRHARFAAALVSAAAFFAGLYLFGSEIVVYAGFAGLVASSYTDLWQYLASRARAHTRARSEIT